MWYIILLFLKGEGEKKKFYLLSFPPASQGLLTRKPTPIFKNGENPAFHLMHKIENNSDEGGIF